MPSVLGWGWGAPRRGEKQGLGWDHGTECEAGSPRGTAVYFDPLVSCCLFLISGLSGDSTSRSVAEPGRQTLRDAAGLPAPTAGQSFPQPSTHP